MQHPHATALRHGQARRHNSAGIACAGHGDAAGAEAHFRATIALQPDAAEAYCNLASLLAQSGRTAEAIGACAAAIARAPDLAAAHSNLGNLQLARDEPEAALVSFRHALRLRPHHAPSYLACGNALLALGRHAEALPCFTEALRLAAGDRKLRAAIHIAIATARLQLGALPAAETACETAIATAPSGAAYHTLAQIRRFTAADPHIAGMASLAANVRDLPVADRIALHFARAKAYDDCADAARAWHHFHAGNILKRQTIHYDEATTLALFRAMAQTGAETLQTAPAPALIFIIGMPRSGTTLVEQMLASHPGVHGGGERRDFGRLASVFFTGTGADTRFAITPAQARNLAAAYAAALPQTDRVLADKMPGNFLYAGLIHRLFPAAKILHLRRDAVDTCFSCYTQLFEAGHPYSFDLAELGRYYTAYDTLMAHWRGSIPASAMLDISYEALVADPRAELARVLAFCGLPWNETCLAFQNHARAVLTASAAQVRQTIHAASIGRSHRYAGELAALLAHLPAQLG